MLRRTAVLYIALAFVTGCLDSSAPGDAIPIEDTSFASALGVNLAASTRTQNGMYYRDITVGTGAVAANGQTLEVKYTGWLSSGFLFDSNRNSASTFPFVLGTGNVIQGWHEGLQGIRVGGSRQLIIPATLAYGPGGSGQIPGNAVIVFTVDVLAVR